MLLNSILYEFLYFLIHHFPNENNDDNQDKEYVNEIVKYCFSNLDKKIQVHDIASYLNLNRSYLTRLFKKHIGVSIKDYIWTTKVSEANKLLKETNLPINVIARSVGYDDQLYFSRVYKEKTGLSAKQYRNKEDYKKLRKP